MKILHAIQDLTPTAGTTIFCQEVCRWQQHSGHDCSIVTKASYSPSAVRKADIVHVHALWNPFNVRIIRHCLKCGIPCVVSTHGCLMPRVFQKGRLKKWLFWCFFIKPVLRKVQAIHFTSEAESEVCKNLGINCPFVIAPLGTYLPDLGNASATCNDHSRVKKAAFLGRLGEEKGLVNLLDAWHQLQKDGTIHCSTFALQPSTCIHKLILAGPDWLDYKKVLDAKIAAEHIEGVEFAGLVQGEAKDRLYREADIFVLPSPMENFSMVVLDALAYGVPAIATKGTPWSELETEHCGWWIDQGVAPLKNALKEAILMPDADRIALGANGRRLAEKRYQWPKIAQKLLDCYKEIVK